MARKSIDQSDLSRKYQEMSTVSSEDPIEPDLNSVHLEALEYAGIKIGETSFPSAGLHKINIPEVRNLKVEFVYNYFVSDERVRNETNTDTGTILNLDTSNSDEIYFQIKNDKLPRFAKIKFNSPKLYGVIKKTNLDSTIENNLSKIFIEGASSNTFYTGVEFIDTGKEDKIYTILSSSIFLLKAGFPKDSPKDAADKINEKFDIEGGLFGASKKLLNEALSNVASEGYVMSRTDVPPEVAIQSRDPISKQSISVQFNNLLMSDTIKASTRIPDTVYQDEMRGLDQFSENIKTEMMSSLDPSQISEAEYEMLVDAVELTGLNSASEITNARKMLPKIKIAGYLIHKYEVLPDGTTKFIGPFYSNNPDSLYIVDSEIRYGGNYIYKIRTLCEVTTLVESLTPNQNSMSQLAIAKVLLASEGITETIYCVERTPPQPPTALTVGFDFRNKLPKLRWQFPINKQRDIKRFQIFKRHSIDDPFVLIGEYDFDDSLIKSEVSEVSPQKNIYKITRPKTTFLDISYQKGEKPIYAVASVDAHGMSSNYSRQVQFEYIRHFNKIKSTLISYKNAPKPYPNLLLKTDAFQDAIKISGYDRMKVFFDPEYFRVFKHKMSTEGTVISEDNLDFLRIVKGVPTYKIHMLNLDLQKEEIVDITLENRAGSPLNQTPASFSQTNLSFEFGVD